MSFEDYREMLTAEFVQELLIMLRDEFDGEVTQNNERELTVSLTNGNRFKLEITNEKI